VSDHVTSTRKRIAELRGLAAADGLPGHRPDPSKRPAIQHTHWPVSPQRTARLALLTIASTLTWPQPNLPSGFGPQCSVKRNTTGSVEDAEDAFSRLSPFSSVPGQVKTPTHLTSVTRTQIASPRKMTLNSRIRVVRPGSLD
jgi:hypothetical protein